METESLQDFERRAETAQRQTNKKKTTKNNSDGIM